MSIATVLTTTNDIRVPRQTAFSTVGVKPESGATATAFTQTGPALDDFTLSAYMAGAYVVASFELLQDVPSFETFAVNDLLVAQNQLEEGLLVSGSGNGQAQGLLGNVGAGVTGATADANGNLVSINAHL